MGVAAAAVILAGCSPTGQSQSDEEKEPHFVLGKAKVNAMDYPGAIEAFEQSLEADPHSAAAHFELGWLYDEKASDPAAAIYHYREYLQLDPQADNAEVIKQRINRCKQQLAADVLPLPSAPAAQQQLEKLLEQNRQLQAQVDHLNDVVKQWNVYYTSQLAAMAARTNLAPAPNNLPPQPQPHAEPSVAMAAGSDQPASNPVRPVKSPPLTVRPRTHTVESGETAMGIARKYGLKLSALETANPTMDPARIRAGQVLNIPPP
ncbi:MAG: tetratricopeptide repeat protein [Verrucomicrobiota bacterium]